MRYEMFLFNGCEINFTDMLKRLVYSRGLSGAVVNVRTNIRTMATEIKENRLRTQLSPYLLQHKATKKT